MPLLEICSWQIGRDAEPPIFCVSDVCNLLDKRENARKTHNWSIFLGGGEEVEKAGRMSHGMPPIYIRRR